MAVNEMPDTVERFASAILAIQGAGANYKMAEFIVQNTGISTAFCGRIVEMRNAGIDEHVIQNILEGAYCDGSAPSNQPGLRLSDGK